MSYERLTNSKFMQDKKNTCSNYWSCLLCPYFEKNVFPDKNYIGGCKGYPFPTNHNVAMEKEEYYNRLAELEDKLENGTLVELPKEKWIITRGQTIAGYNYCIHKITPTANFYNGKWHFSSDLSEAAEWREFVKEFDTKEAAEAELKELQEKGQ